MGAPFSQSVRNALRRIGLTGAMISQLESVSVTPYSYTGLGLWLDPNDLGTFDLEYAADFTNGATDYLSLAASGVANFQFNDTDSSSHSLFTVSFWKNRNADQSGINGLEAPFVSHWNDGVAATWSITSGGSTGEGHVPRLLVSTNGTTAAAVSLVTVATAPSDWSHCMMVYDGSQGTANNRVKWYLDGVLAPSTTTAGTLPAQVPNCTAALTIGGNIGVAVPSYTLGPRAAMKCVGIWKNIAAAQALVTSIYNNGEPKKFRQLIAADTSGLVAYWHLDEPSGQRVDSTSNAYNMLEAAGKVSAVPFVMGWRDKSPNALVFRAMRVGAGSFTARDFCGAPRLKPSIFGTGFGLLSHGYQSLYCKARQIFDGAADFLQVSQAVSLPAAEYFTGPNSAEEADTTSYSLMGFTPDAGLMKPCARLKGAGSGASGNHSTQDTHIYANFGLTAAQNVLTNWQLYGTGSEYSARCRVNGAAYLLDYASGNTAYDRTWADSTGRDNLSMIGFRRDSASGNSTGTFTVYIGETLVYYPGLSSFNNLLIEQWMANRAGITVPQPQ